MNPLEPTSFNPAPIGTFNYGQSGGIAGGDANNANNNPFRQRLLQFLQQIQQGRANGGHPILDWLQQMRAGGGSLQGVGPGHPMDVLSSGRTPPPAVGQQGQQMRPQNQSWGPGRQVGPISPVQGNPFGQQVPGQLPNSPFAGGFNPSDGSGYDPQGFMQALRQRLGGGQVRGF